MKKKWIELYQKDISEIIENLDNAICSHKFKFRHYTRGHMRGNDYCGGDIWEIHCVRCKVVKKHYAVFWRKKVDWKKIEKMKVYK